MQIIINQLGGHTGSFAGDCAIIQIHSDSGNHIVVIDTGASAALSQSEFNQAVNKSIETTGARGLSIITSHSHADHYDEGKVRYITNRGGTWYHGDRLQGGAWVDGTFVSGSSSPRARREPNILSGNDRNSKWQWLVDCWAPNWRQDGVPTDENDLSLATAVYASDGLDGFAFLSLGDMTMAGQARLAPPLFIADVGKFPHHGSENNRISFFGKSVAGVRNTVLISGDSGSAANTVFWLHGENPEVRVRALLKTDAALNNFKSNWQNIYLNNGKPQVNVMVGSNVTIIWSSDNGSEFTMIQTGEQAYKEVVKTMTSKRGKAQMLWVFS